MRTADRFLGGMREFIAIVLSLLLAIAAAMAMWGWWRSPVPTFLVFSSVLHGMMLGAGLMGLVDRLGIRSAARRATIGVTAGVVSVTVLTFGQYLSDAHDYRRQTQQTMAVMLQAPRPGDDALDYYDRTLLEPVTGHRGVIGYLQFRDAQPWRRRLRAVEALLVVGLATTLCLAARRRRPGEVN